MPDRIFYWLQSINKKDESIKHDMVILIEQNFSLIESKLRNTRRIKFIFEKMFLRENWLCFELAEDHS